MNTSCKSWTDYSSAAAMLLAGLLFGLPAIADDTELYFGKSSPDAPAPLVMLTLDLRPNLGANFCSNVATTDCRNEFCGSAKEDPGCAIGQGIYDALYPGAPQVGGIYTGAGGAAGAVNSLQTFVAAFRYILFTQGSFDGMRVGLMMNHDDCTKGGCGDGSNGGYVLRGFELLEKGGDSNGAKQELLNIFAAQPTDVTGSETHPYQGRELFFELYRYLAGLDVLNGKKGSADFGSRVSGGTSNRNLDYEFSRGRSNALGDECQFTVGANSGDNRACADYILHPSYLESDDSNLGKAGKRISSALTWDPGIITTVGGKDRYVSPYSDGENWSCSGAFSINMLFAVSNQDPDSDTELARTLADQGLGVPKPTGGTDGFSQVIAKLKNMDIAGGQALGVPSPAGSQSLTSFFLTDDQGPVQSKGNEYASAGGTHKAIPALGKPAALAAAAAGIGAQINSISSSYVAVTVPVNADNRVTSLPNLFVALFQVDADGKPYWPGNVKKLDIVTTTLTDGSKQLDVKDALGAAAFNPITGRLNDSALTLWTDPSGTPSAVDKYFPADTTKGEVPGRDGSSVRRGGAGQKIPGYIAGSGSVGEKNSDAGARQIFLEPATVTGTAVGGNSMMGLDASSGSALLGDAAIQTLLGIQSASCTGADAPYCTTFINQVLVAGGQGTTGTLADKASLATRLFLRWIRGFDVFNTSGTWNGLTTTVQRKWLMGDVLHSRPLAINYGIRTGYSKDNQDVRLVFGANDGMLRMVRNTASGTAKPSALTQQSAAYGAEVWAFMPRELLANVPTLAMNFGNVGLNRPYGADGQPTLFTIDTDGNGVVNNVSGCAVGANNCDRAWVYFGLRRGGKSYYAVDISSPDAATPNLLWKINESATGFTELGLTFSSPRVGWVRFEDVSGLNKFGSPSTNVPVPVVIFGGGYNGHAVMSGDHHKSGTGGPSKDTILDTPFTGADTNEGNAIFIVHARTGQLIWKATLGGSGTGSAVSATQYQHPKMAHGIAAPVSPMDADGNGILDRLYVADTGGRVWRVDLPEFVSGVSTSTHRVDTWKATVLADLRPSDSALALSTNNDLRFFHGATIVRRARDSISTINGGLYDAIYLGSGDREHPQSETNKRNWFFLLKDRLTTSGATEVTTRTALTPGDILNITDICFSGSGTPCVNDTTSTSNNLANGWRLALEETGEKNLSEPFIGGEGVIFTTYLPQGVGPDDAKCVPQGASRLYQVALDNGAPLRFLHDVVGDTFSKTDRWINLYSGIDGGVVAVSPDFWITSSGKSGKNPPQKPVRFYWRESGVDTVK